MTMTVPDDTNAFHRSTSLPDLELVPQGAQMAVTEKNKAEFVRKKLAWIVHDRIAGQLEALTAGFWSVIPRGLVRKYFTAAELELVLGGVPAIDIEDWRSNTSTDTGQGSATTVLGDSDAGLVAWWWEIVEALDAEHRALLLQFCTGTSRVPVRGFCALEAGTGTIAKFTVRLTELEMAGQLPSAHTCFNRIDLPRHPSKAALEKAIMTVLSLGSSGFSEA